jgi:hypothetical protein
MFQLTSSDFRGIESWYKDYKNWRAKGSKKKYTKEEDDKFRKKCKVGKYRNWEFSEARWKEIVEECVESNKDKYRGKVYSWIRTHRPELADITWDEVVELNLHKIMYSGEGRGKGRLSHLEEELPDLENM